MRIEPPPSVPMWSGPRPAAAAADAPPLEPVDSAGHVSACWESARLQREHEPAH